MIHYSKDFIQKGKAVEGCFAMFLLLIAITFIPLFLPNRAALFTQGLLLPLMIAAECAILLPLYLKFFRKRAGMGVGRFHLPLFCLLFAALAFIQVILPALLGVKKAEAWVSSQVAFSGAIFWLNTLLVAFVAPVYEEIVFRGCLFNAFRFWFNDRLLLSAIATSIAFSATHLQYADPRTFLMLFLISMVFVTAKVKSDGLLMPILLHIAMNAAAVGLQYLALAA